MSFFPSRSVFGTSTNTYKKNLSLVLPRDVLLPGTDPVPNPIVFIKNPTLFHFFFVSIIYIFSVVKERVNTYRRWNLYTLADQRWTWLLGLGRGSRAVPRASSLRQAPPASWDVAAGTMAAMALLTRWLDPCPADQVTWPVPCWPGDLDLAVLTRLPGMFHQSLALAPQGDLQLLPRFLLPVPINSHNKCR